jgi:membrane protein implicated in regulation of membrane protease activity
MMFWEIWWVWLAAALLLAILEVLAPGFIFAGFAFGAAVVGVLIWFGVSTASLPWLLVIFGAVSVIAWVVMRQVFGVRRGQVKHFDHDINED